MSTYDVQQGLDAICGRDVAGLMVRALMYLF